MNRLPNKPVLSPCHLAVTLLMGLIACSQPPTIQEKLGYDKETKLLIIHADDIGVSHSENQATIEAMEKGMVNSGSIMVPCPWFPEIATYAREHPEADFGLHLTLASEWDIYKWGPVLPANQVPSLVNDQGFFYSGWEGLPEDTDLQELENELKAQIDKSIAFGIDPTHLDPHMFLLIRKPEYLQVYMKVGREYQLPVLLNRQQFKGMTDLDLHDYTDENDVIVDNLIGANPEDYQSGMAEFYTRTLKGLGPGLHYIFIHPAYDNPEMQAVTINHPEWGSAWRQADYDYFTSETGKKILEGEDIQLITWREIRDKLIRR